MHEDAFLRSLSVFHTLSSQALDQFYIQGNVKFYTLDAFVLNGLIEAERIIRRSLLV